MSNKFTTNKNAIADCDVCGFQFKLKTLKKFICKNDTNEYTSMYRMLEP